MPRYQNPNLYDIATSRRKMSMRKRRFGRPKTYRKKSRYNLYHFKRTLFQSSNIQVSSVLPYSNHFGFTLGQLPDVSNFTGLYDEYRINKVVIKFLPKFNNTLQGTGIANYMNQVHTAIDYDDSLSLPTAQAINEITQYQSHKITPGARVVTRVIVPKVELTSSGAGQAPKSRQWLDCDNTSVLHNGLKVVIPPADNASSLICYDTQITVYMSFRNVL